MKSINTHKVGWLFGLLVIGLVAGLGCDDPAEVPETDESVGEEGSTEGTDDNTDEVAVQTTSGEDNDDLEIRLGDERWTLDLDTGMALYHSSDDDPESISIREFLFVWYDLQNLRPQTATQLITYSCFSDKHTTWPTPHKYIVRKVSSNDGMAVDFLDPNGGGASYVFQGQNFPTDFTPDHTIIRKMEGGVSIGDGFMASWSHRHNRAMGCIGSPDVCKQGNSERHELAFLLGGFTDTEKSYNLTNCSKGREDKKDPARHSTSIRFFVDHPQDN